ncbi:MAG: tryptophan 2,3-dioxygenase family protein [Flavobacteriales bacterium]|nr:tryptophan 2,3-dioxygenase family protein [Flavobacteriales bacterium]
MYYSSYLQLDKILNAQELESDKHQKHAHDEMLFIVIHQSYELWFKQILFEMRSVHQILSQPAINDNSPELATVVRRLNRVAEILKVLVHKIDILETMTPLDFLEFRDMLRPASGFQSMQFKELEAVLGLRMEQRHGREYYTSQLTEADKTTIEAMNSHRTIIELVNSWLQRMPFDDNIVVDDSTGHEFWYSYGESYDKSLQEGEKGNVKEYEKLFLLNHQDPERKLSQSARRAALFIMLYRDYPILQNPYKVLNHLLEIDELLANWRWRHMNMVHRMVGTRMGTGGSSGKGYLREAAIKHYIFTEIAEMTSFMVQRGDLPQLPEELEVHLGFRV